MTTAKNLLTLTDCHLLYRARFKEGHFAPITRLFHWGLNITQTIHVNEGEEAFFGDIKVLLGNMFVAAPFHQF